MDDLNGAKDLILWARKQGVTLAYVKVGAVEAQISSMLPTTTLPSEREAADGLVRQFGGDVLEEAIKAELEDDSIVPDDED